MAKVLCVDIGTSSLKASVIDENGNSFGLERYVYSALPETKNLEGAEWINAFKYCGKILLKDNKIDAICISGNGPSVVCENARTILWNDFLPEEKENFSSIKTFSLFIPKILQMKKRFPADFNASKYIFSAPEFLIYKLTGKAVTILPEARYEKAYWTEEELSAFSFTEEEKKKLPPFVYPGFKAGNVLNENLELFGLSESVPVYTGGPDFVMALIGTNTLRPGKICDRSGSSEGINFCVEKAVFHEGVRTLPSLIPGLWNLSVLIPESGSLLERFRNEINTLSGKENSWEEIIDYCFSDKNSEGYHEMLKICNKVRNGVELLRKIAEESGQKIDAFMTVTGGQAKNDLWLEKKAVNSGINLAVCKIRDAELSGDACAAFFGMGFYKSISQAADKIVNTEKVFESTKMPSGKYTVYKIPEKIKTIIFDIDSTLYTSESYAIEQVDIQIRHLAQKRGISNREARNLVSEFRRNWKNQHEGRKISLANALIHFGVSIEESIRMREELVEPGKFLSRDEMLVQTLTSLKKKYNLICVTNNPVKPARKTLCALGIDEIIPEIIGLDVCKKSKPAREPFLLAAEKTGVKVEECLSVGDRYDIDISLPLEMGMGGILVSGVKDVYKLPEILGI